MRSRNSELTSRTSCLQRDERGVMTTRNSVRAVFFELVPNKFPKIGMSCKRGKLQIYRWSCCRESAPPAQWPHPTEPRPCSLTSCLCKRRAHRLHKSTSPTSSNRGPIRMVTILPALHWCDRQVNARVLVLDAGRHISTCRDRCAR